MTINSQDKRNMVYEHILTNSAIVFYKKGYSVSTIKDIAMACGMVSGNLYAYFDSKEQILFEILKKRADSYLSKIQYLDKDESTSALEQLKVVVRAYMDVIQGDGGIERVDYATEYRNLSLESRRKLIVFRDAGDSITCTIIRRGITQGIFRKVNEKVISSLIHQMANGVRLWFDPNCSLTLAEVSDIIIDFMLNGLRLDQKHDV